MRLSDIMSKMGLSSYAEVALIIFLIVFLAIAARLFFFSKKTELEHASRLPLEGDDHPGPADGIADRSDTEDGPFRRQAPANSDFS